MATYGIAVTGRIPYCGHHLRHVGRAHLLHVCATRGSNGAPHEPGGQCRPQPRRDDHPRAERHDEVLRGHALAGENAERPESGVAVPDHQSMPALPDEERDFPIDDSAGGCDDPIVKPETGPPYPWTREHPAIDIVGFDGVSESGQEIYNFCRREGIDKIVLMGVHTNICILYPLLREILGALGLLVPPEQLEGILGDTGRGPAECSIAPVWKAVPSVRRSGSPGSSVAASAFP
jgi:hypothetical protein